MPDSVVCVGGTGGSELGDDILWWKDFGREREEEERRGSTQERKSILDTHVVWVLREPLVQTDMQVACYTIQKEEKKLKEGGLEFLHYRRDRYRKEKP